MNMEFSLLIVDDELEVCQSLKRIINSNDYHVYTETDSRRVIPFIHEKRIDLIIMDIKMPYLNGIDLLKILKKEAPSIPVIIISGHATIDDAVQAMRYGVLNIFTKPLKNTELLNEIRQVAQNTRGKELIRAADRIITQNKDMEMLLDLVHKAAPTDAAVIITGESGTGKELITDVLHHSSKRKNYPYIKINCAAIPESLIESEMFGYEKGAFTDAKSRYIGKFEQAKNGTIFLDEIGDMSLSTQSKMLRVLQEKQFSRVGGSLLIHTDCRIIAATNKDLKTEIENGTFREDLYYRLSVITLSIPPLRKRKDDIPLLSEYFLEHFCRVYGKTITGIDAEVSEIISAYDWPGNVRELKNFIERAVIFTDKGIIRTDIIPEQYRILLSEKHGSREEIPDYYEKTRKIILDALKESEGRRADAARLLNISRKTLYNKMKKLNIQ